MARYLVDLAAALHCEDRPLAEGAGITIRGCHEDGVVGVQHDGRVPHARCRDADDLAGGGLRLGKGIPDRPSEFRDDIPGVQVKSEPVSVGCYRMCPCLLRGPDAAGIGVQEEATARPAADVQRHNVSLFHRR